jgi:hypothetical protein
MKALGYAWRVLVNLFYVAIVLYVFEKLHGRHETTILVAVIGLVYVAIRGIAIAEAHVLIGIAKDLAGQLIRVRELLHDKLVEDDKLKFEEQEQVMMDRVLTKLRIDGLFLGVVSLICLLVLFTELS